MQARLAYVMKFVADMEKAVRFHRNTTLKFQSPGWSEFSTGDVILALHPANEKKPAGSVELGYRIAGLENLHAQGEASGLTFTGPLRREHGVLLAQFLDSEGAPCSASE